MSFGEIRVALEAERPVERRLTVSLVVVKLLAERSERRIRSMLQINAVEWVSCDTTGAVG